MEENKWSRFMDQLQWCLGNWTPLVKKRKAKTWKKKVGLCQTQKFLYRERNCHCNEKVSLRLHNRKAKRVLEKKKKRRKQKEPTFPQGGQEKGGKWSPILIKCTREWDSGSNQWECSYLKSYSHYIGETGREDPLTPIFCWRECPLAQSSWDQYGHFLNY